MLEVNIEYIHFQHQGYSIMEGIGNVKVPLTDPLEVTDLQNSINGNTQEIMNFNDRVCSDMIDK